MMMKLEPTRNNDDNCRTVIIYIDKIAICELQSSNGGYSNCKNKF